MKSPVRPEPVLDKNFDFRNHEGFKSVMIHFCDAISEYRANKELIAVASYKKFIMGISSIPEEILIGRMTPNTKIGGILSGQVENIDHLHHLSGYNPFHAFSKVNRSEFILDSLYNLVTSVPDEDLPKRVSVVSKESDLVSNPLVAFYVGNNVSLRFLESNLRGYQYTQLSNVFGGFPFNEEMLKRVYNETWDLLDKTFQTEAEYNALLEKRNIELKVAEHSDLIDEVSVKLHNNRSISEKKVELDYLVNEGICRGYSDLNSSIERNDGRGKKTVINLKDFYKTRAKELGITTTGI